MVGAQEPALQKCSNPVHPGHGLVGRNVGAEMHRSAMVVAQFLKVPVGRRPVAVDERVWLNSFLNEWNQAFVIAFTNLPDPDSAKSLWLKHLHRYGDQHFAGIALPANRTDRAFAVGDGEVRLVDLNFPMQQISSRPDHCPAQPMQHRPSRLVAAESKNTLQPQRTDAMLLVGDVPNTRKPDAQLGPGLVKYGSSRHCCLGFAMQAHQSAAG